MPSLFIRLQGFSHKCKFFISIYYFVCSLASIFTLRTVKQGSWRLCWASCTEFLPLCLVRKDSHGQACHTVPLCSLEEGPAGCRKEQDM